VAGQADLRLYLSGSGVLQLAMHLQIIIKRDCAYSLIVGNLGSLHPQPEFRTRRRGLLSKCLGLDQPPGMEVASLAIGIAALYTTCRDCYSFFTSVQTAESKSSSQLRELEIQQSILKAWGMHWQIQQIDSGQQKNGHYGQSQTKLHDYFVRNPYKADGVFKTLSALADTLSDQDKLSKRYGIQLRSSQAIQDHTSSTDNFRLAIVGKTIKDVNSVISEVQNRLSTFNRLK
jgi:hypothetical protein